MNNDLYFYTETAFHHQGDVEYLKELIDISKESGAQGVKFQVLTVVEEFISTDHSSFEELSEFCLDEDAWLSVFKYTIEQGLDIIAMPLNISSFKILNKHSVKFIDIHSVSFNDEFLKEAVKKTNIPILLSSGGRTYEELLELYWYFGDQLYGLIIGFQAFPSNLEEVKLSRINYLKSKFDRLKIGYADHSKYDSEDAIEGNLYARLLGASIFEKHVTLKEGDTHRVDYISAVGKEKLTKTIQKLERLDRIVDSKNEDQFAMSEAELIYRNRELKVVAKRSLIRGSILTQDDVCLRMIDKIGGFSRVEDVINLKILEGVDKHQIIPKNIVV